VESPLSLTAARPRSFGVLILWTLSNVDTPNRLGYFLKSFGRGYKYYIQRRFTASRCMLSIYQARVLQYLSLVALAVAHRFPGSHGLTSSMSLVVIVKDGKVRRKNLRCAEPRKDVE